jgi:ABC-type Fe3+/spermidine/putrescine transport system ATPase subunit
MLSAVKITYGFVPEQLVFSDLSLRVEPGEIISIVGASGIGKSTLLKCLAGKLQLVEGTITIDNERVLGPEEKLLSGHDEISLVDQSFSLDEYFSVAENIANQLLHLAKKEREEFTNELLHVFGLEELRNQPSRLISGGEKQRLSMACALAKEPKYLLLDEPFSNLDVHLKRSIGNYLRNLQALRNMGVVLVTHDGIDALSWSDTIYFFKRNGKLRKYSPKQAYFSPKNLFEGRFFGELNSVYVKNKQILFRPTAYQLEASEKAVEINVTFFSADFHGHYYANYFKLANGKSIVLYANRILAEIELVYV